MSAVPTYSDCVCIAAGMENWNESTCLWSVGVILKDSRSDMSLDIRKFSPQMQELWEDPEKGCCVLFGMWDGTKGKMSGVSGESAGRR